MPAMSALSLALCVASRSFRGRICLAVLFSKMHDDSWHNTNGCVCMSCAVVMQGLGLGAQEPCCRPEVEPDRVRARGAVPSLGCGLRHQGAQATAGVQAVEQGGAAVSGAGQCCTGDSARVMLACGLDAWPLAEPSSNEPGH